MKKCSELLELISVHADGELTGSDKRLVEEHLSTCESCSALLEMFREISASVRESCVAVPEALRIGVMNRIHGERAHEVNNEKQRGRFHVALMRYAPIAACLVVMLLVWQFRGDIWGVRENAMPPAAAPEPAAAPAAPMEAEMHYDDAAVDFEEAIPSADAAPAPMDAPSPEDRMFQGDQRSEQETERIMQYISGAYAEISVTGELPALLSEYEPEPFGAWFGWEMVFEIPASEVPALLAELSDREDVMVTHYDSNSTYAVVMYSRGE